MRINIRKQVTFILVLVPILILIISWNNVFASNILVIPDTSRVRLYETLFIHINLIIPFQNPYNPEHVRVDMVITTPSTAATIPSPGRASAIFCSV